MVRILHIKNIPTTDGLIFFGCSVVKAKKVFISVVDAFGCRMRSEKKKGYY